MRYSEIICIALSILLLFQIGMQPAKSCKDIIVVDDATKGDFNLFLKVRDPSRPGYQVLTIVPEGYQYSYHHPWTGKEMEFTVEHKYFGVASVDDIHPNIIKAGMCLTDAGIVFGDADTVSNWKNPTRHAWDDFDWIRYACQTADTEEEAVELLTEDAVKKLHATGVPENLFVVGPDKGFVIEADVIHYDVEEVDSFVAMSNYAKNLWKKSFIYRAVAPSYDAVFEGSVRKGRTVRLGFGSIFGIKITDIGTDYIEVKQVPIQFGKDNILGTQFDLLGTTKISLDSAEKVGFYRVRLHDIEDKKAKVTVCFEYKEWEDKINDIIQQKVGEIDVIDLMNWSRIHSDELDGLRGMCDENIAFLYEGDLIAKIPNDHYELISQGWFSANHPCVSIYVPFHICDYDIYDPYENSEAAQLCLSLLDIYGHDYLSEYFNQPEQVFINELEILQPTILEIINQNENISAFLTSSDTAMQKQAYFTQLLWLNASKIDNNEEIISTLSKLWENDYTQSLLNMKKIIKELEKKQQYEEFSEPIISIALSIVQSRLTMCEHMLTDKNNIPKQTYNECLDLFQKESYDQGFTKLMQTYNESIKLLNIETSTALKQEIKEESNENDYYILILFSLIMFFIFITVILGIKQRNMIKK